MEIKTEDRNFGMLIWLLGIFTSILVPIVLWLVKRDQSAYVDAQGKAYLNFGISYFIWLTISGLLMFVLIGFITTPIIGTAYLIFNIIGVVKANEGIVYKPFGTIPFLK
ncbi:DUF4870 domain-containing protein [Macrococcus bovicus]|uniref:DUF4870 domain-containing protein n=1 Tax=Macrococcus bovicus TaxID=69968 RepID=A0A4R6BZW3_9STAP|nr:DUF4870 domain-containing protein [Macrococcus bovicus]TDM14331.1 DUF4870 domain-containing protein [Macrococcus bovicus]